MAAISIPSNIAGGIGRKYKKDTARFLHIARGSSYELETILDIAVMAGIIPEEKMVKLLPLFDECVGILNGLINRYERDGLR